MLIVEDSRQKVGKHTNKHKYWQENGVFYVFHIVFCEELRAEAERIAQEWMESFP